MNVACAMNHQENSAQKGIGSKNWLKTFSYSALANLHIATYKNEIKE